VIDRHLPILFEQQQDPAANRMAAFTARDPADRAAFDAHWAKIRSDPTVTIRAILFDGQLAGSVARYNDRGFFEVTYWLGREYWGKGIATRALSALLEEVKERPLYAGAAADNVASLRVLEKCGFLIVGRERGFADARGQEIDEVLLKHD
jgi:RimJ/RimL family protein N-acetyltransferase